MEILTISREDLLRFITLKSNYCLIDVRGKDELVHGMIPTAKHVPVTDLDNAFDLAPAAFEQKYGFDEFYNDVDAIENQNLSEEAKKRMAVGKFGRLYNSTKIDNFSETERREIRINRQRYIDMLKGVDKGTKDMLGSYLNFENPDDLDLLIWTKIDKDLSINLPFL